MRAVRSGRPKETEKGFQAAIIQLASFYGWKLYHTHTSIHSPAGWPDLVLCRPPQLLIVEVKSETGVVSAAQWSWLDWLGHCPGVEVHIWRPRDWTRIVDILRV